MKNIFSTKKKICLSFCVTILLIIIIINPSSFFYNKRVDYSHSRSLHGVKFASQDSLGHPRGILYKNKYIIIYDKAPINDSNQVKIYDAKSQKLVSSFGRKGMGPGEYRGLWAMDQLNKNNNKLTLVDIVQQRFTVLDISDINKIKIDTMISLKSGGQYCSVLVNDSTIISLGLMLPHGRYAALDMKGNIVKYFGEILPGKKDETPITIHSQAALGRLKVSPDGTKYVITAQYSDIIDVYSSNGELIKRIKGPINEIPKYSVKSFDGKPAFVLDQKRTIWGYLDLALTNDRIIALFAGLPFQTHECEGKYLHIYDMKGDLKETIVLDHDLFRITYDEFNRKLYGIQLNPTPEIYVYQL